VYDKNHDLIFSNAEKALCFSEFFCSIGCIDNGTLPLLPCSDLSDNTSTFNVFYFTDRIVFDSLNKLSNSLSAGPDNIPPLFFKNLSGVLCSPLSIFFNLIMQKGEVPSDWRLSNVIPVFKKDAASNVDNYRPIALTSCCCKVFEACLKPALISFLNSQGFIFSEQHGFLARRSTCTNLLECLNTWSEALDSRSKCPIIFFDFAKAFDSVSIRKLCFKLKNFGIIDKLLSCFESLLSARSFRVKVASSFSPVKFFLSGVPQGSILGPIFFLLFINDLSSKLPANFEMKLFADDVKSFKTLKHIPSVSELSCILEHVVAWSRDWQLPLALNKCSWMMVSNITMNPVDLPSLSINGVNLDIINEVIDLGILFKSNLNFSDHTCSSVQSQAEIVPDFQSILPEQHTCIG